MGGGELPVEVGVQRVRGVREDLVRVRPLLGGVLGLRSVGVCSRSGSVCVVCVCVYFFWIMSLKFQQYAFIQLEEASVAEQRQGGGGYAGGRERGWVTGEASALPLSRSDRSLVCSSCQHHSRRKERERERGEKWHRTCWYHSNDLQHLQRGSYTGF